MDFARRQQGQPLSASTPTSAPSTSIANAASQATSTIVSSTTTPPPPNCSLTWDPVANTNVCVTSTAGPANQSSVVSTNVQPAAQPTDPNSAASSIVLQPSQSNNATGLDGKPSDTPRAANGLSGGAVAGVAIGMLIVGLLIAGAVFFFLLRRQKKKRYDSVQSYPPPHTLGNGAAGISEKGPTVLTSAYATNIDDMLPQPVADDTITDTALKIRDNIKNHVRTYYHVSPVPTANINQANLGELAIATGTSSATLASMLSNISTRAETLRLVVAWVVLSRCTGESKESLLPEELATIATAIPGRDGNNVAQSAMYSKWKTITGALLHERIGQNAQDPDRKQRFAGVTADLESIVAPFVQSGLEAQRSKNQDMILTRSANFAFLLFSQPGAFRFEFSSEHGGLVVFPGLVQTIGDQGQMLGPSRVLLEKEIAA